MSTNTTDGIMPGEVAPENDEGIVTGQGNNPQNTTNNSANFKAKLIAAYARIKNAIGGFCIDRGIATDSILMIALMTAYLIWRAAQ